MINDVITSLEKSPKALFKWFKNKLLKSNADKYHLIVIDECDVRKSECEKLLGVKFDTKLTFENHITNICGKARRKIYDLAVVCKLRKLAPLNFP